MSRTRKDDLKMYRRARGGRTLPRSGGGAHPSERKALLEEAEMRDWRRDLDNYLTTPPESVECWYCGDDGEAPDPRCWACAGTGFLDEAEAERLIEEERDAERADNWRGD
jgi:hypothetical protein